MTIKTELIKSYIAHSVCSMITDFEIDEEKVADAVAIRMLGEIQEILNCNDLDDFEKIEEIVMLFSKFNIDFGDCHNF